MEFFRKILDTLGDEIVALKDGSTVQWANETFCSNWKVTLGDLRKRPVSEVLPGPRLARALLKGRSFKARLYTVGDDSAHGTARYRATYLPAILPVSSGTWDILVLTPISGSPSRGVGTHARLTFSDIIGVSKGIKQAIRTGKLATRRSTTVLIKGESGVGKDVFAQAIHNESGSNRPFVAVNCAALPRELMESELFGYMGGSFTGAAPGGRPGKFELADGGTIFLDEIGELPLSLQPKLLRVLQTKEITRIGAECSKPVQVKVIAATKQDLEEKVREGSFRDDLFYRLNVITMRIPPLRERGDDVPLLVKHFLSKICPSIGIPCPEVDDPVMEALTRCMWPGNVRQLENVIERELLYLPAGERILKHIPDEVLRPDSSIDQCGEGSVRVFPGDDLSLRAKEKQMIIQAIERARGNTAAASRMLGISRATLYRKMERYGIE
ncbi:MAG: sigma 54-interacting transcriptional regulator [bacterium]|nr:sigma 54-interacting transcriptional regulator [bacterium]